MESEKPILCMEHCIGEKMFGFVVPLVCHSCGKDLKQTDLRIPPFRLPSPFRNAQDVPCAIVLKPTNGDFLTSYKNSDDLHIGLTSSEGSVYEFDSKGLSTDKTNEWTHCLAIEHFTKASKLESWPQYWDFTLQVISGQNVWIREFYDEHKHNCYNFVLNFLRALQIPELNGTKDRECFIQRIILPKTAAAAKYLTLYRKLLSESQVNEENASEEEKCLKDEVSPTPCVSTTV